MSLSLERSRKVSQCQRRCCFLHVTSRIPCHFAHAHHTPNCLQKKKEVRHFAHRSRTGAPSQQTNSKTALESVSADAGCETTAGRRRQKLRSGCRRALKGVRPAWMYGHHVVMQERVDRLMEKSSSLSHARRACMARRRRAEGAGQSGDCPTTAAVWDVAFV